MDISFHHANPAAGNESFLLRFGSAGEETPCVLVDAGRGVDVTELLGAGDFLAAICLTHAHRDHYESLSANHRDDVPVFTSPATAAILEDVLDVAHVDGGVRASTGSLEAITPIETWTTVAPGIEIHPVPAGHTPGAVGFLVCVTDDETTRRLLVTGDFTRRRAAGFPGFAADEFVDVDVLFLCAATNDAFRTSLTDALGTALEYALSGARTLVTTSGLTGVHVTYLLSALIAEHELHVPVRAVGQVAKLYDALSSDRTGVETVPFFEHTDECLEPGTITVAGPDRPDERSSGRLFGVLRDDPNACVVQLIGSGREPLTRGRCTIHAYDLVNHPAPETLTAVHDSIRPTQTVITHRHRGAEGEFNELDSVVWASGDTDEYTLFDGDHWRLPPWMGGGTLRRGQSRCAGQFAETELLESLRPPSIDRNQGPEIEAEGVDTDRLAAHLHRGPNASASLDVPHRLANADADTVDADVRARPPDPPTMTSESTNSSRTNGNTERGTASKPIRAVGADTGERIDPEMRELLDERGLTRDEFVKLLEAHKQRRDERTESSHRTQGDEGRSESTEDLADDASDDSTTGDEQTVTANEEADAGTETGGADRDVPPGAGERTPVDADRDVSRSDTTTTADGREDASDSDTPRDRGHETGSAADAPAGCDGEDEESALSVCLSPLVTELADQALRAPDHSEHGCESLDEIVVTAVSEYVIALLAGEASGTDDERVRVDLSASPDIDQALTRLVAKSDRFDSVPELVVTGVSSVLDGERETQSSIDGLEEHHRSLAAIARNSEYAFDTPTEVAEAAVLWFLRTRTHVS